MNRFNAVGVLAVAAGALMIGAGIGHSSSSTIQEAAACWAGKLVANIPAAPAAGGSERAVIGVVACRNLGGLDGPALLQLSQMLQGELQKAIGGRYALSATVSTYDLEGGDVEEHALPRADFWVEPGVAYAQGELVLSAKLFSRSLQLLSFLTCTSTISAAEIQLFALPAPMMPGTTIQPVLVSQPLPFKACGMFAAQLDETGAYLIAFIDRGGVSLFEMRENTLLMKFFLEMPTPAVPVRDLRGAVWIGKVENRLHIIAQRSCDRSVSCFAQSDDGFSWAGTQAPFNHVPLSGLADPAAGGLLWRTGRNFMVRPGESGAPAAEYYGACAAPGGPAPRLISTIRNSTLEISPLAGGPGTRLPLQAGDALAATTISGEPVILSSRPGNHLSADALRGTRLSDGTQLFEESLTAGQTVKAIASAGNLVFLLAADMQQSQHLRVYEIKSN